MRRGERVEGGEGVVLRRGRGRRGGRSWGRCGDDEEEEEKRGEILGQV